MITAVHTLIYSDDPAATRAFFRDVLELPWVSDAGSSAQGGVDTIGDDQQARPQAKRLREPGFDSGVHAVGVEA